MGMRPARNAANIRSSCAWSIQQLDAAQWLVALLRFELIRNDDGDAGSDLHLCGIRWRDWITADQVALRSILRQQTSAAIVETCDSCSRSCVDRIARSSNGGRDYAACNQRVASTPPASTHMHSRGSQRVRSDCTRGRDLGRLRLRSTPASPRPRQPCFGVDRSGRFDQNSTDTHHGRTDHTGTRPGQTAPQRQPVSGN